MMRRRIKKDNGYTISLDQLAEQLNVGKATARKIAEESGSVVRIGRCYRVLREQALDYVSREYGRR